MSNQRVFPSHLARYVNAVLMTCGMYNGSLQVKVNFIKSLLSCFSFGDDRSIPFFGELVQFYF